MKKSKRKRKGEDRCTKKSDERETWTYFLMTSSISAHSFSFSFLAHSFSSSANKTQDWQFSPMNRTAGNFDPEILKRQGEKRGKRERKLQACDWNSEPYGVARCRATVARVGQVHCISKYIRLNEFNGCNRCRLSCLKILIFEEL